MERDDLLVDEEYARSAHHDDAHGKEVRKNIWKVTAILTAVTILEVFLGAKIGRESDYWTMVKWSFIALTLLKAGYIVIVFMHLGDERKSLKYTILVPYIFFILYLIFIALTESTYINGLFYGS